jgi:hypothetical protein
LAKNICRSLFLQVVESALSRTMLIAGMSRLAKMAIIVITTNSSMREKAVRCEFMVSYTSTLPENEEFDREISLMA